jgi:hypothetical protein
MRGLVSPVASRSTKTVAGLLLAVAAAGAFASEGSIQVRPGDVVGGTLVRCGDRQTFETELVQGEKLSVGVALADVTAAPELRIETADGTDVTDAARVVSSAGVISAGPFRVPESGIYRVSLTSSAAHEVVYTAWTRVARRRAQTVRVPTNGRTVSVLAAAGSTLTVAARRGAAPSLVVGFPGEAPRELAAGDPLLAALEGGGLSAPCAGTYTFAASDGAAARVRVVPPATAAPRNVPFPALPDDGTSAWYPATGWVAAPDAAPAAQDPPAAPPPPVASAPSLEDLVATPAPVPSVTDALSATTVLGPAHGVGVPLAGAPLLAEIFVRGVATDTAAGRSYSLTVPRPGFGDVTYEVSFTIDGLPAAAPLSFAGRMSMTWSVTSGAPTHAGRWTLTLDPVRGVQILDGAESLTDAAARTTSASAHGFVAATSAPAAPSGVLTWSRDDPRNSVSVARRETYDGTATVRVEAGPSLAAADVAGVTLSR